MIVGLGTGSTAYFLVEALGKRVHEGLRMTGIPTSEKTSAHAKTLGIPLSNLDENSHIDIMIDGADEVAMGSLDLVKGLGGALLREKIVASASARLVIIVDETKLVDRLASRVPVPVEVVPFGWQATQARIEELGARLSLRTTPAGEPFVTDGGHFILDSRFAPIDDPRLLDEKLNAIVGVVEHGLVLGMTSEGVIGTGSGVKVILRD